MVMLLLLVPGSVGCRVYGFGMESWNLWLQALKAWAFGWELQKIGDPSNVGAKKRFDSECHDPYLQESPEGWESE